MVFDKSKKGKSLEIRIESNSR